MKTEMKWAIILAIVTLLWFILVAICGFDKEYIALHETTGWFYLIPFSLVFALALLQKKKEQGGTISFGQGVKTSFIIAVISLPLILLVSYVKIKFISPNFLQDLSEFQITKGADEKMVAKAFSTSGFLLTTAIYPFFGVIIGAIISFFIKTK